MLNDAPLSLRLLFAYNLPPWASIFKIYRPIPVPFLRLGNKL